MLKGLKSKRIRLRHVKLSDAESIAKYAKNHAISRYTFIPRPYLEIDARAFIKICHGQYRQKKYYNFGIELLETGQVIGMMGIVNHYKNHRNAEIGYWLGKPFWGKGLAGEALELILKYCFKAMKLHRVYAHVMHPNISSSKLLLKHNFKPEGIARQQVKRHGKWMDMHWFGLLAKEYKQPK